ncbi:hypothetical protein BHM03_00018174 [Ensete ventricosum]|nr:hypothetical protein BHM03_00018174 [Ensete ventricosum]
MPGEMRCEEEEEEEEEEEGEGEDGKAGEGSRVTAADEGNEESQLPGGRAGLEEWGEETTAAPSSGAPRVILPANQLYGDVCIFFFFFLLACLLACVLDEYFDFHKKRVQVDFSNAT